MPELQDIFNHVRPKFMSSAQAKAFHMIRHCRTSSMGYHSEVCTECGSVDVSYNPHVHCLVPGGGLSNDGLRFVRSSKKFFIPVKVISKKFRGKFLHHTHRVAISNSRIKTFDGETVSFGWKDYKDGDKSKVMTLSASEFVRRFLLHVLPDRFGRGKVYPFLEIRNVFGGRLRLIHLKISSIHHFLLECGRLNSHRQTSLGRRFSTTRDS